MKTNKSPRMTRRVGDGRIEAQGRTVRAYDYCNSIVLVEAFRSFHGPSVRSMHRSQEIGNDCGYHKHTN